MYLNNYEIQHLRKRHPCLLDQINGYGIEPVANGLGYDTTFDMSDSMFYSVITALKDAEMEKSTD